MSYLVFCTFDLKNGSAQDYKNAYSDLAKLGLTKVHENASGGQDVVPTTAAMGFVNSPSAIDACRSARDAVKRAFAARGLDSELFFVVGGDWSWVADAT